MPLFVYQIYKIYNEPTLYTNLHLPTLAVPILLKFHISDSNKLIKFIDSITIINLISLLIISFLHQNFYGIAAGVTFATAHFVITDCFTFRDSPAIDFNNYCMCFYTMFAFKAIND